MNRNTKDIQLNPECSDYYQIMLNSLSKMIFIISIGLLTLTNLQGQPDNINQPLPDNPINGRIIFEDKGCIDCHSIEDFVYGSSSNILGNKDYENFYGWTARLLNHAPQMAIIIDLEGKKWPSLTSPEIDQLITYLYFLRYLGEPGDATRGEVLYNLKGCVHCHSIGNMQNNKIPLDELANFASPIYISQKIWNHGPNMQEKVSAMGFDQIIFESNEIVHISAYLRKFNQSQSTIEQFMSPGNPQKGSILFKTKGCGYCHSEENNETPLVSRLSEMALHKGAVEIATTMWNHGISMWDAMSREKIVWPVFENDEMADLISFLYFLNYSSPIGNPINGKKLFQEKACNTCHGPQGNFQFDKSLIIFKPSDLVSSLWNHVPHMSEVIAEISLEWPIVSSKELSDLYSYLYNQINSKD